MSKVSAVFCFAVSFIFVLATGVLVLVTIGSPAMFPALVFFSILAAASLYAGFYFLEQHEVRGYAKWAGKNHWNDD